LNKSIAIKDYISVAEHLIAEGYTHPSLLCGYGSSAGGLLIGSVINMKPNLLKAAVLHFPFLDPLSILLDSTLPLTESDYDEFGNPLEDAKIYDSILSYSP
jgi:oligopeptidase B